MNDERSLWNFGDENWKWSWKYQTIVTYVLLNNISSFWSTHRRVDNWYDLLDIVHEHYASSSTFAKERKLVKPWSWLGFFYICCQVWLSISEMIESSVNSFQCSSLQFKVHSKFHPMRIAAKVTWFCLTSFSSYPHKLKKKKVEKRRIGSKISIIPCVFEVNLIPDKRAWASSCDWNFEFSWVTLKRND
jgi:hypothetical protein